MKRRCGWCAVRLRWWQWVHCRICGPAMSESGLYLQNGGPPCRPSSRYAAESDKMFRKN